MLACITTAWARDFPCDLLQVHTSLLNVLSQTWLMQAHLISKGNPTNSRHKNAVLQLIHHPEYNLTLILWPETVVDISRHGGFPSSIPNLEGLRLCWCIHQRLLPQIPGHDGGLEQFCTLFGETISSSSIDHADIPTTLILMPIIAPGSLLPYYHPTVSHLAFWYISSQPPILQIDTVLLPHTPTDLNSWLYRTCLSLLNTLHRYG